MSAFEPCALTDPAAPSSDDGEFLALARLRYPRRAVLCSPSPGTERRVAVCPGQGLELRTARPVRTGSTLLLLFHQSQTLLAYVASTTRQEDGSWRIQCRLAGVAEAACVAQPA